MAIKTTAGNNVKFLGISKKIREDILKAILGNSSNGSVSINPMKKCYLGLSKTDPATSVTEPTDSNYRRIKIGEANSSGTFESDYMTFADAQAVNSSAEIKFNRSLSAWTGTYPYFFLTFLDTGNTNGTIMAWGELTEPLTVGAKNVVPLFEESKFKLYFPAPGEIETLADGNS